jgi:hypothetical protein
LTSFFLPGPGFDDCFEKEVDDVVATTGTIVNYSWALIYLLSPFICIALFFLYFYKKKGAEKLREPMDIRPKKVREGPLKKVREKLNFMEKENADAFSKDDPECEAGEPDCDSEYEPFQEKDELFNAKQRCTLYAFILAVVGMVLYPPFHGFVGRGRVTNEGYAFIFSPPLMASLKDVYATVNVALLLAQVGVAILIGIAAWLLSKEDA